MQGGKANNCKQRKKLRFWRLKRHYAARCGLSMRECKEGCTNVRLTAIITTVLIKVHVFRQRVTDLSEELAFSSFRVP